MVPVLLQAEEIAVKRIPPSFISVLLASRPDVPPSGAAANRPVSVKHPAVLEEMEVMLAVKKASGTRPSDRWPVARAIGVLVPGLRVRKDLGR